MSIGYENVLKRLKEERLGKNWSQQELAHRLQMEQSHYSKVELGTKRFTFYELQRLCNTGLDVNYMYTGKRLKGKKHEFKDSCNFPELFCFIGILYEISSYMVEVRGEVNWNKVREQIGFMQFFKFSYKCNSNIFYVLRKYSGYTQYDMAEILHMDVKRVRTLENGKTLPDSEILWILYDKFHIPPSIILQESNDLVIEISSALDMLDNNMQKMIFTYFEESHNLLEQLISIGENN